MTLKTTLARLALASILAVALTSAGCGRSVEGETRSWNNNKLELEKYAGKYAGLKGAINAHVATAQKQYDDAQKLSDEEAKAKALSLANQKLLQVLAPFRKLDKVILDVEALKRDPALLKLSAEKLNPAIKLADAGLVKAKAMLDGEGVDTSGALVGKVEEAARAATLGAAELRALKSKVAAKASKKAAKKARKAAKKAQPQGTPSAPKPAAATTTGKAPAPAATPK